MEYLHTIFMLGIRIVASFQRHCGLHATCKSLLFLVLAYIESVEKVRKSQVFHSNLNCQKSTTLTASSGTAAAGGLFIQAKHILFCIFDGYLAENGVCSRKRKEYVHHYCFLKHAQALLVSFKKTFLSLLVFRRLCHKASL